ncbi:SpaA isopeptide-forming pilin-related protein [Streptomyces sp. NPDC051211]|uniref:MSCRAMM family protein n=1 Tax=Streptomyces sp. NPDC051211 TaxID=3154643 RepID=UPI00344E5AC8
MKVRKLALAGLATAAVLAPVAPAHAASPAQPDAETGNVWILKTDQETRAPLRGALFQLWRETNGRTGLQTDGSSPDELVSSGCRTEEDGWCGATVPLGTYYWEETTPPPGYGLPSDPVSAPLVLTAENAEDGVTAEIRNVRDPYQIKVVKKDAKTKRPLRGAVFELWREVNGISGLQPYGINPDVRTGSGCATDGKGVCSFTGLDAGQYYLRETDVPEGYVLPADPVTGPLTLDGQGRHLEVKLFNQRDEHGKGPRA